MSSHNVVTSPFPFIDREIVPDFVRQDHKTFVKLLEAFYEWASSDKGAVKNIREFQYFRNIDYVIDQFYDQVGYELLAGVPPTTQAINKAVFVQRIKDFYITRGSEESFDFMFRYLYDQFVQINYPKDTLLRVDSGAYIQKNIIRTKTSQPINNFANLQFSKIVGLTSGAFAYIEGVAFFDEFNVKYTEWSVANIYGTFVVGEDLKVIDPVNGNVIQEPIMPSISGMTITDPGQGYTTEDAILHNDQVYFMNSAITSVDNDGGILSTRFQYAPLVHNVTSFTNYVLYTESFAKPYWSYPGYIDLIGSTTGKYAGNRPLAYVAKTTSDLMTATINLGGKAASVLTIQMIIKPRVGTTVVGTSVTGTYVWSLTNGQVKFAGTRNVDPRVKCTAYLLNGGYYLLVATISSHVNTDNILKIQFNGPAGAIWPLQGIMVTDASDHQSYIPVDNTPKTAFQNPLSLRPDATLALFKTNIEALVKLPGYYDNTRGLLSDANNLHDGYYYQEFSYVITTTRGIAEYEDIITDTIHPAGMKMFGTLLIEENLRMVSSFTENVKVVPTVAVKQHAVHLGNKPRVMKRQPTSSAVATMRAIQSEVTPYKPTT